MKQNNKKKTWKAVVAVILVMVTLFSISTIVSAEFVELLLGDEIILTSVSGASCKHPIKIEGGREPCDGCQKNLVTVIICATDFCNYENKPLCASCKSQTYSVTSDITLALP